MKKLFNYREYLVFPFKLSLKMKLTVLLTIAALFQIQANTYSQNKKISLDFSNTSVEIIIHEIETISEFKFLLNRKDVDLNRKITIKVEKEKIENILSKLFSNTDVAYEILNKQVVLKKSIVKVPPFPILGVNEPSNEPTQFQITGTIEDQNGMPLPGANILEKGTTNGTQADFDGNFSISVTDNNVTLIVSYIGYATKDIPLNGQTSISVRLEESAADLDEVVIVGYGTTKKVNLTGSVSVINSDEINVQPVGQTTSALMGKAAGVTILQNSGQPGADGGTVRIRGVGTLGNSNPLILIDGISGDLNEVDPSNIESISVLKDAASAAIYGSRAANGVVLVTTKRGKAGKVQINYSNYIGVQRLSDTPEYVNSIEYMNYFNLARQNEGADPLYSEETIAQWEANYKNDPDHYPNTNWVKSVYSEPGLINSHDLSVSGGTDNINLFAALGYVKQEGNIPNFSYQRTTIRVNTDVKVTDKLELRFDLNGRVSLRTRPSASSFELERGAFRVPPIYADIYSDGSWGPGWPGTGNPVAFARAGGLQEQEVDYFRTSLNATYEPIKDLKLSFTYAPEFENGFNDSFKRQYEVFDVDTGDVILQFPSINSKNVNSTKSNSNFINFIVNYSKEYNDHYVSLLGGYEFIDREDEFVNAYRNDFPLQDFQELDSGSIAAWTNSGNTTEYALQSFFGRLNYTFKEKYLFEANVRYDGSSRFNREKRYGLFPSFSVGWRLSEEQFLKSSEIISNLKLRASWGQLGNQNIGGLYPYLSTIEFGQNYIFGNNTANGAMLTDLANPFVSWETAESTNFGLDLALLGGSLGLNFDYFVRNTKDILLQLPIPFTVGLNAPFQNAGEVRNTGWDLSLFYRSFNKEFKYDIDFNLSNVKNEVVDLKDAGPFINSFSIIKEGEPINSIYGLATEGFFESQQEIDESPTQPGNIVPGDLKYKDLNNDGIINADDRMIIGNPFPRFSFGLNLSASYKNFDMSVFMQGVGDSDVYLQGDAGWAFNNAGSMQEWQKDFWTVDNPNASYPRLSSASAGNNFQVADFWVYNTPYLRFRNITIGYTIPSELINNIGKVRLFLSGQNVLTILEKTPPGWDPVAPNGTSGDFYPVVSTYSAGISLKF